MKFKEMIKREEGAFITRYDLCYETVHGQDKIYEMISRDKNLSDFPSFMIRRRTQWS